MSLALFFIATPLPVFSPFPISFAPCLALIGFIGRSGHYIGGSASSEEGSGSRQQPLLDPSGEAIGFASLLITSPRPILKDDPAERL